VKFVFNKTILSWRFMLDVIAVSFGGTVTLLLILHKIFEEVGPQVWSAGGTPAVSFLDV
jgi:hypothetical protein